MKRRVKWLMRTRKNAGVEKKERHAERERSVNLAFGAARACEAAGRAVANEAIPALGAHAIVHARLIFALLGLRATRRTNCTYTNAKFWR